MTAKEYSEKWISEGKTIESIFEILKCLYEEGCLLVEQGKISSMEVEKTILLELDRKWREFARLFHDEIDQDLFQMFYSMELLGRGHSLSKIKSAYSAIWPNKRFPQEEIVACLNHMARVQSISLN